MSAVRRAAEFCARAATGGQTLEVGGWRLLADAFGELAGRDLTTPAPSPPAVQPVEPRLRMRFEWNGDGATITEVTATTFDYDGPEARGCNVPMARWHASILSGSLRLLPDLPSADAPSGEDHAQAVAEQAAWLESIPADTPPPATTAPSGEAVPAGQCFDCRVAIEHGHLRCWPCYHVAFPGGEACPGCPTCAHAQVAPSGDLHCGRCGEAVAPIRVAAEAHDKLSKPPAPAPSGAAGDGLGFLVVIHRETETSATFIATEVAARAYFDDASAQWSESFLCRVVEGPRDIVGEHAKLPTIVDELQTALTASEAAHDATRREREDILVKLRAAEDGRTAGKVALDAVAAACGVGDRQAYIPDELPGKVASLLAAEREDRAEADATFDAQANELSITRGKLAQSEKARVAAERANAYHLETRAEEKAAHDATRRERDGLQALIEHCGKERAEIVYAICSAFNARDFAAPFATPATVVRKYLAPSRAGNEWLLAGLAECASLRAALTKAEAG